MHVSTHRVSSNGSSWQLGESLNSRMSPLRHPLQLLPTSLQTAQPRLLHCTPAIPRGSAPGEVPATLRVGLLGGRTFSSLIGPTWFLILTMFTPETESNSGALPTELSCQTQICCCCFLNGGHRQNLSLDKERCSHPDSALPACSLIRK